MCLFRPVSPVIIRLDLNINTMKIPRKLKIGGRTIKVRTKVMKDLGLADYERGYIWLKRGMTREAKEAVFIHEAAHHCNSTISHNVLDSLSEQLYQVFKQMQ